MSVLIHNALIFTWQFFNPSYPSLRWNSSTAVQLKTVTEFATAHSRWATGGQGFHAASVCVCWVRGSCCMWLAVYDVRRTKCVWGSVWINSMCERLTTLWESCWFSTKGHLCHFLWPSRGCDCDNGQFPLCRMAVFLYKCVFVIACLYIFVCVLSESADTSQWSFILQCLTFHLSVGCDLYSTLHKRPNTTAATNKLTISTELPLKSPPKKEDRSVFSPQ